MRTDSTSHSRRMPFTGASALSCLLLALLGLLSLQTAHPATNGSFCMICQDDGCGLSSGEYAERTGIHFDTTRCVDWDNTPPGHCAAIAVYEYAIYDAPPTNPNRGYLGNCYRMYCEGAFPTHTPCPNPRHLGGHPVRPAPTPGGHGKASPRLLSPVSTCQEGG